MNKLLKSLILCFVATLAIYAQTDERHQMSNSHVSINAIDFRSSRNLETVKDGNRDFIMGKAKTYDNAKDGEPGKLFQPYAEYGIKSKMAGGTFKVTIIYKIDKEERKENKGATRKVRLALDEHSPVEIELKESGLGYLKAVQEFDMKFLRGKNHVVKLWLPSRGVMVDKIDIRRKLFK